MIPKRLLALTLFAALAVMPTCVLRAQWVQADAHGFYGDFYDEVSLGNKLFVGTDFGLFCTTDTGNSWKNIGFVPFMGREDDVSIEEIGKTIYVSNGYYIPSDTIYGGNLYSTDTGKTWASSKVSIPETFCVLGSLLFAGGGLGVYISTDSGKDFVRIDSSYRIYYLEVLSILSVGSHLIARTYPDSDNIFISYDSGISWQNPKTPIPPCGAIYANGGTLIAAAGGKLFRSTDTGVSWLQVGEGVIDSAADYIISYDSALFVDASYTSSLSDIFCSTDDGLSWFLVSNSAPFGGPFFTFGGSLFKLGCSCYNDAIYRSTDSGVTWKPSSEDLSTEGEISSFGSIGNTLFTSPGGGGDVFRTTDLGLSWRIDSSFQDADSFYDLGDKIFILSDGVSVSSDSGNTWLPHNIGLPSTTSFRPTNMTALGSSLFLGTDGNGLFRSSDSGNTWEQALNGTTMLDSFPLFMCAHENSLFVATWKNGVFRSTDNGETWINLDSFRYVNSISGIWSMDNYIFAQGNGIYRSSDNGISWIQVNSESSINSEGITSIGNYLFISSYSQLQLSTDFGDSWINITPDLLVKEFSAITIFNGNLFVLDASDVWRCPLSDFGIDAVARVNPLANSLKSYPNPLSQSTSITFTLPEASEVTLTISDAAGRETPLLRSAWMDAGQHEITWDASNYPSGVYLCRLSSGGESVTQRVVVLK